MIAIAMAAFLAAAGGAAQPGPDDWMADAAFGLGKYAEALENVDRYLPIGVDDPDGYYLRAQIEARQCDRSARLGNATEACSSATTAIKHYMIVNDSAGAARAQALLDSLHMRPRRLHPRRMA